MTLPAARDDCPPCGERAPPLSANLRDFPAVAGCSFGGARSPAFQSSA
ncbi:hypothetical protein [Devosia sp. DBB001]|nr:hypothetical protein [Devosia sp. DBB001]